MRVPDKLHELVREMHEEVPDDARYREVIVPTMMEDWYGELDSVQCVRVSSRKIPLVQASAPHDKLTLLYDLPRGGHSAVSRHISPAWREQSPTQARVYALARRAGEGPFEAHQAVEVHEQLERREREVYLALLEDRTPWEMAAALARAVQT